ncbi:MAG: methyltransferase domain-containing protein, partial [Ignavibacterium sp.]|nr:methyltransferase domain-containing protein [Ignavibacterium sp.]
MKRKDGYVVDTTYPVFFYKEMQPIWLNTVVQFLGFKTPSIRQKFSYLELACATGVNLLVAAMNHPHGSFIGVDFNPQHIELARKSAQKLGLKNIEFIHADFSEFLRSNTQQFDFIVNHGTFTWISSEQQQHILDIIDQSLKEFGICYLHYMCYPGSKDLIPLQKLFSLVDEHQSDLSVESIGVATQLFNDLNDAGAFLHQSKMEAVLNTLKNSSTYLAHEFLTDHWKPLFSVDLHKMVFEKTRMNYLGSANPCENLDSISIPANLQCLIRDTQQPALK